MSGVITFRTDLPIRETMAFERVYEQTLQLDLDSKTYIIENGIAVWMLVDGELAGETYGLSPAVSDEDIEDTPRDPAMIYCYSTTILPKFQGRKLSKILCAFWLGQVKQAGFRVVAGHTTSPAMTAVKASFGAEFTTVHERWYGTKRTAQYYRMTI